MNNKISVTKIYNPNKTEGDFIPFPPLGHMNRINQGRKTFYEMSQNKTISQKSCSETESLIFLFNDTTFKSLTEKKMLFIY